MKKKKLTKSSVAHDHKAVEVILIKHNYDKQSLIAILQDVQNIYHYLPENIISFIAKKLDIPVSKVYGVATFYSQFALTPRGKHHISVCMGTACYVKGAPMLLEALKQELGIDVNERTEDGKFSLVEARCLGCCGLAPVIMVDEQIYDNLKVNDINKIIDNYK